MIIYYQNGKLSDRAIKKIVQNLKRNLKLNQTRWKGDINLIQKYENNIKKYESMLKK